MRTFAAAKVIIALAKSYQYAEKEQFSFQKRAVGCFLFSCIYGYGQAWWHWKLEINII